MEDVTDLHLGPVRLAQLGAYIREQRENAQYSLRQLASVSGVSNPYLSQIERGLRKPSADVLQQLAKALQISAETLYVRAGLLDGEQDAAAPSEARTDETEGPDTAERTGTVDARASGTVNARTSGTVNARASGTVNARASGTVLAAITADPHLTPRQKSALREIYLSLRGQEGDKP
jgi:transcriptional regulator with XRE-family HTH domain